MLPQKYHDELPPLKSAAARIIFRALMDYVHNKKWSNGRRARNQRDRTNKELFEKAREWLFDDALDECVGVEVEDCFISEIDAKRQLDSFEELMSFASMCGVLGWDPRWIRRNIPRLKAADLRRVARKNGFV